MKDDSKMQKYVYDVLIFLRLWQEELTLHLEHTKHFTDPHLMVNKLFSGYTFFNISFLLGGGSNSLLLRKWLFPGLMLWKIVEMRGIIYLVSTHIHCFVCIPDFKRMIHAPFSSMLKYKMSNNALHQYQK